MVTSLKLLRQAYFPNLKYLRVSLNELIFRSKLFK